MGMSAWLAFALYYRIRRDDSLDNPNRRRILEAIRAQPSIRIGTLKKQLGLNYQTVLRHIQVLERFHMVESVGEGQRRYFLNGGSHTPREKEESIAANAPAARAVLDYVLKRGPTELPALREALNLPRSTASDAVARLAKAGLVVKRHVNGRLVVAPPFAR